MNTASRIKTRPVIAIACGGTGGHFYPGLSIALAAKARGAEPVLFIGGHHTSSQIAQAQAKGLRALAAPVIRWPHSKWGFPLFAVRFVICILKNRQVLRRERVDVALGMGSFASAPMCLAACLLGRPLVLHEGNARLGRANRYLSRWARVLGLALPLQNGEKTRAEQRVVGMPLRQELLDQSGQPLSQDERRQLCRELGLEPRSRTILVFGGSQGAAIINSTIAGAVAKLGDANLQVLHLTGNAENAEISAAYEKDRIAAAVLERSDRMGELYRLADLVVCRGGGSTIAETTLFAKPAIYIPLVTAMDDHQTANTACVCAAGGGLALAERALTVDSLAKQLANCLENPDTLAIVGEKARSQARPAATRDMVDIVYQQL